MPWLLRRGIKAPSCGLLCAAIRSKWFSCAPVVGAHWFSLRSAAPLFLRFKLQPSTPNSAHPTAAADAALDHFHFARFSPASRARSVNQPHPRLALILICFRLSSVRWPRCLISSPSGCNCPCAHPLSRPHLQRSPFPAPRSRLDPPPTAARDIIFPRESASPSLGHTPSSRPHSCSSPGAPKATPLLNTHWALRLTGPRPGHNASLRRKSDCAAEAGAAVGQNLILPIIFNLPPVCQIPPRPRGDWNSTARRFGHRN